METTTSTALARAGDWLTLPDAAAALDCTTRTVQRRLSGLPAGLTRHVRFGELPGVGRKGAAAIHRDALDVLRGAAESAATTAPAALPAPPTAPAPRNDERQTTSDKRQAGACVCRFCGRRTGVQPTRVLETVPFRYNKPLAFVLTRWADDAGAWVGLELVQTQPGDPYGRRDGGVPVPSAHRRVEIGRHEMSKVWYALHRGLPGVAPVAVPPSAGAACTVTDGRWRWRVTVRRAGSADALPASLTIEECDGSGTTVRAIHPQGAGVTLTPGAAVAVAQILLRVTEDPADATRAKQSAASKAGWAKRASFNHAAGRGRAYTE